MRTVLVLLFSLLTSACYSPARAYDTVSNSIVRITGLKDGEPYVCTGFVIMPSYILTAEHCLGDAMRADGQTAAFLRSDPFYDLALVRAVSARPATHFRDRDVAVLEHLTAVGYAYGLPRLTVLPVQAILVNVQPTAQEPPGLFVSPQYIQGMSGGPVLDAWGDVVGMVQQRNGGVGFGVTVPLIRAFLLGL